MLEPRNPLRFLVVPRFHLHFSHDIPFDAPWARPRPESLKQPSLEQLWCWQASWQTNLDCSEDWRNHSQVDMVSHGSPSLCRDLPNIDDESFKEGETPREGRHPARDAKLRQEDPIVNLTWLRSRLAVSRLSGASAAELAEFLGSQRSKDFKPGVSFSRPSSL